MYQNLPNGQTQIPEEDEAKQLVSDGVPATGWFLQEKTREECWVEVEIERERTSLSH